VTISPFDAGHKGLAYQFDGTAVVAVPHHEEFQFPGAFMVQAAVKPPPGSGEQTILEKAGDYRLALVDDGGTRRARFTVTTDTGEESVTSVLPVPSGAWSVISGRYEGGRLWIGIGESDDFTLLSGPPVHAATEIQIGPAFVGELDEIRITDLASAPLSAFANGQQTLSFVADASGTFQTDIVSTGNLGLGRRTVRYYQGIPPEAMGLAQDDPSVSDEYLRVHFTQTSTYFEDRGMQAETWYGIAGYAMLAAFFKFGEGIWAGTDASAEIDPIVLAGDIIGSIWLAPISITRDAINSGERAVNMSADATDGANMALAVVHVGTAVASKKVALLEKLGKLGRMLKRGGTANRAVSRLIAKEVRAVTSGLSEAQRVKKIVEVAALSIAAGNAVAGILQSHGEQEENVGFLNDILETAENPEEVAVELGGMSNAAGPDGFRLVLDAFGTPHDDGSPAADVPGAIRKFINPTRKALRGAKESYTALRTEMGRDAFQTVVRIARKEKANATAIFEGLSELAQKAGPDGVKHVARMARRLGARSPITRAGQRFVIQVMRPALANAKNVQVEAIVRISKAGKQVRRYYDLIIDGVHYECKNWIGWATFPPSKLDVFRRRAFATAQEQFLRDIAYHGPDALARLRWVVPKEFLAKHGAAMRTEMENLVRGGKLKKYMGAAGKNASPEAVGKYEATLRALGINPSGIQGPSQVGALLVSHP
jgi:hypothetical protein